MENQPIANANFNKSLIKEKRDTGSQFHQTQQGYFNRVNHRRSSLFNDTLVSTKNVGTSSNDIKIDGQPISMLNI